MSEMKQKTKSELMSEMRELQQEYSKRAAELKAITSAEEEAEKQKRQNERLENFKSKYNFFIKEDGSLTPIDWNEVNRLVTSSFGQQGGYSLGFDQTGAEGLGHSFMGGSTFSPMVEDETAGKRFFEREQRRVEFAAKMQHKHK